MNQQTFVPSIPATTLTPSPAATSAPSPATPASSPTLDYTRVLADMSCERLPGNELGEKPAAWKLWTTDGDKVAIGQALNLVDIYQDSSMKVVVAGIQSMERRWIVFALSSAGGTTGMTLMVPKGRARLGIIWEIKYWILQKWLPDISPPPIDATYTTSESRSLKRMANRAGDGTEDLGWKAPRNGSQSSLVSAHE
jgi:hypothetical protein